MTEAKDEEAMDRACLTCLSAAVWDWFGEFGFWPKDGREHEELPDGFRALGLVAIEVDRLQRDEKVAACGSTRRAR